MMILRLCFLLSILLGLMAKVGLCNMAALEDLMSTMQDGVLEFASEVEAAYAERCSDDTLAQCYANNYDDCLSEYPNQSCPGGSQFTAPECGDGEECGSLLDFTVSAVRLPDEIADGSKRNPTDDEVIETVCYTRAIDGYMKDEYSQRTRYGINPPQMYFGALDGAFRIFPARHSKTCGSYDARLRPWYQAGSSGPKDVVLILDQSGSMNNAGRIDVVKKAAARIIETLTVADRVAVVGFSDSANPVAPRNVLISATKDNKEILLQAIEGMEAAGKTNFKAAFEAGFDLYRNTIENELHSGCNAAFLFFTDGEMTTPSGFTEDDIVALVKSEKASIEAETNRQITLFSYSLGDGEVHTIPRRLGCETSGLWTKIEDERYLVERMASYYKLFALGLGENSDFAAWVEPYAFASGSRELGTTVSAPVYNRNVTPPLFLGVVGIDFPLSEMDKALGVQAGSRETLDAVVRASTAKCPALNLTLCQLESLRRQAGGDDATCFSSCTEEDFTLVEPRKCAAVSDYPTNLWANTDHSGADFEDKVCCKVGEDGPSETCLADDLSTWKDNATKKVSGLPIVGIIVGVASIAAIVVACVVYKTSCKAKKAPSAPIVIYEANPNTAQVLPPPTAPPADK